MLENEIKNYIQLANLALKLEVQANNIEKGDAYYEIVCIERFPYFVGNQLSEPKNAVVKEYLEMLISAFLYSCKFTYEATDPTVLEALNSAVEHFCNVIASRKVRVQPLPMAKPLNDLYNSAYAKLLKNKLSENAANLERLKKSIFHGWTVVG